MSFDFDKIRIVREEANPEPGPNRWLVVDTGISFARNKVRAIILPAIAAEIETLRNYFFNKTGPYFFCVGVGVCLVADTIFSTAPYFALISGTTALVVGGAALTIGVVGIIVAARTNRDIKWVLVVFDIFNTHLNDHMNKVDERSDALLLDGGQPNMFSFVDYRLKITQFLEKNRARFA